MVLSWNKSTVFHISAAFLIVATFNGAAVAAQSYTCSAGAISHIECFLDDRGYISDIRYISNPFKAVTSCQSTEQQLSTSTTSDFAIAAGEYITALTICSDSAGVRGISVSTSLGQAYNCGYTAAGCVTQQGGQALGGFAATCTSSSDGLQRVLTVESPCWLPNYRPPTSPSTCPPGQGSPGGGLPCKACPVGEYGDGDSGMCVPCAPGAMTLEDRQSSCGCLPGYGTTKSNQNECSECPAGSYSSGGSMSTCTKCPAGFDSEPGSPSLRFCVCKAGFGYTAGACKRCERGYYSPGPIQQALSGAAAVAAVPNATDSAGRLSPGMIALQSAVFEGQEVATEPTYSKCIACGDGYTTATSGASSNKDCIPGASDSCAEAGKELLNDVCVCSPGYEPASDGSCTLCDTASYKEEAGDEACQPCDANSVPTDDRTACIDAGSSPPPTPVSPDVPTPSPSPPPVANTCVNDCVECDIAMFVEDISISCGEAPDGLVFADSYCFATNTDAPNFATNPSSVLESSFGDLRCAEIQKLTSFLITVTDVGSCRSQPLTCTVTGYAF